MNYFLFLIITFGLPLWTFGFWLSGYSQGYKTAESDVKRKALQIIAERKKKAGNVEK